MNKYLSGKNSKDCCGCVACAEVCPAGCIEIMKNAEGFLYPVIENFKCIECDACVRVCPMEKEKNSDFFEFKAYSAYSNDFETIMQSSSGGIFSVISEYILNENGIVFGAYLDEKHKLRHIGIDSKDDLYKLRGSKYIQSDMREVYGEVKIYLENGKKVLFSGTPCQVYGLKRYLNKDYYNLYTLDVICHGIPSQKMFDEYVSFLEKKHKAKLVDINFRDKTRNGWSITLRYTMEKSGNRKNYYLISPLSEYFSGFLRGYILRESCYDCKFSTLNRQGDITMGDFWGYQKTRPELKHDEGLSLLLINSNKGMELQEVLNKAGVCLNEISQESIEKSENRNLYFSTTRPKERENIYNELEEYGFEYIAKKYLRKNFSKKNFAKNYLPKRLIDFLKNI